MAFNFDPKQTAAPPFGSKPAMKQPTEEPEENPLKKKKKAPKAPASMRGLERATEPPEPSSYEPM